MNQHTEMRFFNREHDLADLDEVLESPRPQLVLVSGRRRVGKTTLLLEWVRRSGVPMIYWVASRSAPAVLLKDLSLTLWRCTRENVVAPSTFSYPAWGEAFEQIATLADGRRFIAILDEFAYAAEADPSLPSLLQNAWDQRLKKTGVILVLAGSHIGMMDELQHRSAPLHGRFTHQLRVDPMPFRALRQFLPRYTDEKRVAVYAILGGMPAYLEQFSDRHTIRENLERTVMRRTGMLRNEPSLFLNDLVREPRSFAAVLRAIAGGSRTPDEIDSAGLLPPGNVGKYLARLVELHVVERRLPVTLPRDRRTTQSRYVIRDPYFRFYFRFIEPNLDLLEMGLTAPLWAVIERNLRAFIGLTAFEDLCREWTVNEARQSRLSFVPEAVGSHWSATVQADVVALSRREKAVLVGECKWGGQPVARGVVRELLDHKIPAVLAALPDGGKGFSVVPVVFSRAGFTPAAQDSLRDCGGMAIGLERLTADLER